MDKIRIDYVHGGLTINCDCMLDDAMKMASQYIGTSNCIIVTDPPYNGILSDEWDHEKDEIYYSNYLIELTKTWTSLLRAGGAMYMYGGTGKYKNRPFFRYLCNVEHATNMKIQSYITWNKKRGYGSQHNYLYTREELVYMVKGTIKTKPSVFNIPYLDSKRTVDFRYSKYKPKSEYKRRTNIWSDINEFMRNKLHSAQKPEKCYEIPIITSSNENDVVIDMFAGSGTCGIAARNLNRRFVLIEKNKEIYTTMLHRLKIQCPLFDSAITG